MMGIFGQAASKIQRPRGGAAEDGPIQDSEPDETSILDEKEGSIIMSLISQLRIGMDLQKVTFPTFVLEPRSMLERITDFMSHPDLIFGADENPDPEERFLSVLRYYLSGWHIKPKGVKKPYNPVLGEFFRCRYDYPNNTQAFYIAEQVSHHPPISAYYYISPKNKIRIIGELRPKSKFLGNSVSTTMEGENRIFFMSRPEDGEYVISMPNMYARGILFGKMVLELGDTCTAKNENNHISCDLEFKTKGFFSGTYNAISGRIRHDGTDIGEIGGKWSAVMDLKTAKVRRAACGPSSRRSSVSTNGAGRQTNGTLTKGTQTGERTVLFDAESDAGKRITPKYTPPEDDQEPNESRRLWKALTDAINEKNMEAATEAKSAVEDAQRIERRKREQNGEEFVPRFFEIRNGRYVPKFTCPDDPDEAVTAVQKWIWPGPTP